MAGAHFPAMVAEQQLRHVAQRLVDHCNQTFMPGLQCSMDTGRALDAAEIVNDIKQEWAPPTLLQDDLEKKIGQTSFKTFVTRSDT